MYPLDTTDSPLSSALIFSHLGRNPLFLSLCFLLLFYHEPEFEFGAIIPVTVKEIRDYGVIVEFAQGGEALLHKTQISHVPHKKVSGS